MNPPPAAVAAAPPPAAGGSAASAPPGLRCCWWHPGVSRPALTVAQIGMAAAAAALAVFALTLQPAAFPHLPAQCVTTPADAMDLRFHAAVLLLYAMAQGGAATASLIVVPPFPVGWLLACAANLLGMLTLVYLVRVVPKALFATGALCARGTALELLFPAVFAGTCIFAVPFLWIIARPQDYRRMMN